ncbi:UNVERIFIED_CONTAM: hypothetical protein FKN15_056438 [Acipenser sinensis]
MLCSVGAEHANRCRARPDSTSVRPAGLTSLRRTSTPSVRGAWASSMPPWPSRERGGLQYLHGFSALGEGEQVGEGHEGEFCVLNGRTVGGSWSPEPESPSSINCPRTPCWISPVHRPPVATSHLLSRERHLWLQPQPPPSPWGDQGEREEAPQLAQEDTLSIAPSWDRASFSSSMEVGGELAPLAEAEPSTPSLLDSTLALMRHAAAFLQVPWTPAAEPGWSVLRTQAMGLSRLHALQFRLGPPPFQRITNTFMTDLLQASIV